MGIDGALDGLTAFLAARDDADLVVILDEQNRLRSRPRDSRVWFSRDIDRVVDNAMDLLRAGVAGGEALPTKTTKTARTPRAGGSRAHR